MAAGHPRATPRSRHGRRWLSVLGTTHGAEADAAEGSERELPVLRSAQESRLTRFLTAASISTGTSRSTVLARWSASPSAWGIRGRDLRIMDVDAAVQQTADYAGAADLARIRGRGGTDMRIGIKAALELKPRPHAVVVFTDGYRWPGPGRPDDRPAGRRARFNNRSRGGQAAALTRPGLGRCLGRFRSSMG